MGEDGDAVGEAWAGAGEIAIGVDGEDAALTDSGQIAPGFGRVACAPFSCCAVRVVAAGHDQDNFGVRLGNLLGGDSEGWLPCCAQDVFASGFGDHFGNPMAADIKRIEPFETKDTGACGGARSLHFDRGDLLLDGEGEGLRIAAAMRGFADTANIFPDVGKRVRRERKDARAFREAGERAAKIVGRNGANVAEFLRDDQVRRDFCEQVGIDSVDAFAAGDHVAHLAIHFAGRDVEIQARTDERRLFRGGGREVAFVRYAGNGIAEAEGVEDFGRGRQQRANLHSGSLAHAIRRCEFAANGTIRVHAVIVRARLYAAESVLLTSQTVLLDCTLRVR